MYIFRVNKLAEDFIEGRVTEREKFKYLLVWVVLLPLLYEWSATLSEELNLGDYILLLSSLFLVTVASILCFKVNSQNDSEQFLERYICLYIPIMIQLIIYCSIGLLIIYFALYFYDHTLIERIEKFDKSYIIIGQIISLIFYGWLYSKIQYISNTRMGPFYKRIDFEKKSKAIAIMALSAFLLPAAYFQYEDSWDEAYLNYQIKSWQEEAASVDTGLSYPDLNAEEIMFDQPKQIHDALANLRPSTPNSTDMYFISFGSYGYQNVFMNEALQFKEMFDKRFNSGGRSLAMVNNPDTVENHPLATYTNLREVLSRMAESMNVEEDILFLFLTSHGSREHYLSVNMPSLPLNDIHADSLADAVKESGIKWKVYIVSACFSGGFIESLKDETSLIITSARKDRSSFGCSDDAEYTYFGRAFFQHGLEETNSFTEAYPIAASTVYSWEEDEGFKHSYPQMASTPLIEEKLNEWMATLPADSKKAG
ncbi:MAG: C13 family peptidase [Nitrospinales bacterium]